MLYVDHEIRPGRFSENSLQTGHTPAIGMLHITPMLRNFYATLQHDSATNAYDGI